VVAAAGARIEAFSGQDSAGGEGVGAAAGGRALERSAETATRARTAVPGP
jgi:hypothetical protein